MFYPMIVKNFRHQAGLYRLHLISTSAVYSILVCFLSFAHNQIILDKLSQDSRVEAMCQVVGLLIVGFVLFYMTYTNRFFTRRRLKELGIDALLGFNRRQILGILAGESLLMNTVSFGVAAVIGSGLNGAITMLITRWLALPINGAAIDWMNPQVLCVCGGFMLFFSAVMITSDGILLWRTRLMAVVRAETKQEVLPRQHPVVGIVGICLLMLAYGLALDTGRGRASLWTTVGFSPMAFCTLMTAVIGTVLVVRSAFPLLIAWMKKRFDVHPIGVIALSKIVGRIRLDTGALLLLVFLSAGTLCVFGATLLSVSYPKTALLRIVPSALEVPIESAGQLEMAKTVLDQAYGPQQYTCQVSEVLDTALLPGGLPEADALRENSQMTDRLVTMSQQDYKALTLAQGQRVDGPQLSKGEGIYISYQKTNADSVGRTVTLKAGQTPVAVQIKAVSLENVLSFANAPDMLVLSDEYVSMLKAAGAPSAVFASFNAPGMRDDSETAKAMQTAFGETPVASAALRDKQITEASTSTFLLIAFISVICFIATGTLLYFKNRSAALYDREMFKLLSYMGYRKRLMKQIVAIPIISSFVMACGFGIVHSIFGIYAYQALLIDTSLVSVTAILKPLLIAYGLSLLVYGLYAVVTVKSCWKAVLPKM